MDGSDQKTDRSYARRDPAESKKSLSKTEGSKTKPRVADDATGMATETKMGIAIIVILVCAFGFLVYHKFDLKRQRLANIEHSGDIDVDSELSDIRGDAKGKTDEEQNDSEASGVSLNAQETSDLEHTQFSFLNADTANTAHDEASADDEELTFFRHDDLKPEERVRDDIGDSNGESPAALDTPSALADAVSETREEPTLADSIDEPDFEVVKAATKPPAFSFEEPAADPEEEPFAAFENKKPASL